MEYLSIKGSKHYLIDMDSSEGYAFSSYGAQVEKVISSYVVAICNVLVEVDTFSILNDVSSNMCEVYYKGKRAVIKDKGMNVFKRIPKHFERESHLIYRIKREECPGLVQILIPFRKGKVSLQDLSSGLGISLQDWK